MAELQIEAYLAAVNALSLVDQKVAWIAIPLAAEPDYVVRRLCPSRSCQTDVVLAASETKEAIETYPGGTVLPWEKGPGDRRHQ